MFSILPPKYIHEGTLLNVMWQPGWKASLGESGYKDMCGWVSSVFTETIIPLLIGFTPRQNKKFKTINKTEMYPKYVFNLPVNDLIYFSAKSGVCPSPTVNKSWLLYAKRRFYHLKLEMAFTDNWSYYKIVRNPQPTL